MWVETHGGNGFVNLDTAKEIKPYEVTSTLWRIRVDVSGPTLPGDYVSQAEALAVVRQMVHGLAA